MWVDCWDLLISANFFFGLPIPCTCSILTNLRIVIYSLLPDGYRNIYTPNKESINKYYDNEVLCSVKIRIRVIENLLN